MKPHRFSLHFLVYIFRVQQCRLFSVFARLKNFVIQCTISLQESSACGGGTETTDSNNQDHRVLQSPRRLIPTFNSQRSGNGDKSKTDVTPCETPSPAAEPLRGKMEVGRRVSSSVSVSGRGRSQEGQRLRAHKSLCYFINRPLPSLEFLSRESFFSDPRNLLAADGHEFDSLLSFLESSENTLPLNRKRPRHH